MNFMDFLEISWNSGLILDFFHVMDVLDFLALQKFMDFISMKFHSKIVWPPCKGRRLFPKLPKGTQNGCRCKVPIIAPTTCQTGPRSGRAAQQKCRSKMGAFKNRQLIQEARNIPQMLERKKELQKYATRRQQQLIFEAERPWSNTGMPTTNIHFCFSRFDYSRDWAIPTLLRILASLIFQAILYLVVLFCTFVGLLYLCGPLSTFLDL